MTILEDAKSLGERVTGYRRPDRAALPGLTNARKPHACRFRDDGETPNNPHLPLLHYRAAVKLPDAFDPAAVFEALFARNGWRDSWRDGIYPFLHFHTRTHEVLGIARGTVSARFGGARGRVLHLKPGDVVVLPAGTGHRRIRASRDLLVVGAYPQGGHYDEPRPRDVDHDEAIARVAEVKLPRTDPVYGRTGPLKQLWRKH